MVAMPSGGTVAAADCIEPDGRLAAAVSATGAGYADGPWAAGSLPQFCEPSHSTERNTTRLPRLSNFDMVPHFLSRWTVFARPAQRVAQTLCPTAARLGSGLYRRALTPRQGTMIAGWS